MEFFRFHKQIEGVEFFTVLNNFPIINIFKIILKIIHDYKF